ncbi:hypothetical protein WA026_004218 [Henosepilachna vigintioctopunctata]|uniref:Uncharacterized protein n=1 Tax=Henosepilachna vigintioctopunctata TaxID=420089 RepID=A0AAW1U9Z3_9CUCU
MKQKRKRDQLTSPDSQNQDKKTAVSNNCIIKENRENAFDLMRSRPTSIAYSPNIYELQLNISNQRQNNPNPGGRREIGPPPS